MRQVADMQLWNSAFSWGAGNDVLQTTFTHRRAGGRLAPLPSALERLVHDREDGRVDHTMTVAVYCETRTP